MRTIARPPKSFPISETRLRDQRYYFERLKGLWKLEAIDFADMPREDTGKEDFFEFYERFANDSVFQLSV